MRQTCKAFSLTELIVLMAILAVLLSLLLPSLSQARKQANRASCSANLHTWGQVALAYAANHRGMFPTAYGYGQGASPGQTAPAPTIFPLALNLDSNDQTNLFNGSQWITYGTPYSSFLQYGGTGQSPIYAPDGTTLATAESGTSIPFLPSYDPTQLGVNGGVPTNNQSQRIRLASWMVCPSSEFTSDLFASADPGSWGYFTMTTYMYVGGTTMRGTTSSQQYSGSGFNNTSTLVWGQNQNKPAVHSYGSPGDILGADAVAWAGSSNGGMYLINHTNAGNPQAPDFQNVLYADGHVQGIGNPSFYDPISTQNVSVLTANDWAVAQAAPSSPQGPMGSDSIWTNQSSGWCFYWPNMPVGGTPPPSSGGITAQGGGPIYLGH